MSHVKPKLRGRTYWMRVRVPAPLVEIIGKKEITKSLDTSDLKIAQRLLKVELGKVHAKFAALEAKSKSKALRSSGYMLREVSSDELMELVREWFIQDRDHNISVPTDPVDAEDVEMTLLTLDGELADALRQRDYTAVFGIAGGILEDAGIKYKIPSDEFNKFCRIVMRAKRESLKQTLADHRDDSLNLEQETFGRSRASSMRAPSSNGADTRVIMTFAKLCRLYEQVKVNKVRPNVFLEIKQIIRTLDALIGSDTDIAKIDNEYAQSLFDLIKQLPKNCTKKYPGMPVKAAIALGNDEGVQKIGAARVNTYMLYLRSIFKYATRHDYVTRNPISEELQVLDDRLDEEKRDPFTREELKSIFSAPIFTGCVDDERNYDKVGKNNPRRARFWVPLIALWTGMRLEEICQLDAADVSNVQDVNVIQVRPSSDKQQKNKQSKRTIPIHTQLQEMGFLDYVAAVKKAGHKKLFPELALSSRRNYSQSFSKWFARLLIKRKAKRDTTCFHSFRHCFRDALRAADAPEHYVELLGGWKRTKTSSAYGKVTPLMLNECMVRTSYEDLDLSHLYASKSPQS